MKNLRFIAACIGIVLTFALVADATQSDLTGPAGSVAFGKTVLVLPNGNIVVNDPNATVGGIADAGAVYLYDGATLNQVSALTGTAVGDRVGQEGLVMLPSGNFLVLSTNWNGTRGAVTFCNGSLGCSGSVSAANSLVGSTALDNVGQSGTVTVLTNGNYVVKSSSWDNQATSQPDVGAITWGSGTLGVSGAVSSSNSLVGTTPGDGVGSSGVVALSNGNYVVASSFWDNFANGNSDAGAATWGNGSTGTVGAVSESNSLVGPTSSSSVASDGVTALTNGNYVVVSPSLIDLSKALFVGAATWGNGATGTVGLVSSSNSIVGQSENDNVGSGGVVALANGNYVVRSPNFDDPVTANLQVGAATWGNGETGTSGYVSSANSLVGSTPFDQVSSKDVLALTNGNYVVMSMFWNDPSNVAVGAATWGNGATGTSGVVSGSNSLVGTTASDNVGNGGGIALTNGNYVIISTLWDNFSTGVANVGAITWGSGATGISGSISAGNSLIGGIAGDRVGGAGQTGVMALSNGNYVVASPLWDNPSGNANVGAFTWGNGATGTSGLVSASNSLVGSTSGDINFRSVVLMVPLSNGNYVVKTDTWRNGSNSSAGAVTWGNGATGIVGVISAANSLVGTHALDAIGSSQVLPLSNGNYVVVSRSWDSSTLADVGAITWGSGTGGTVGPVSESNSVYGAAASDLTSPTAAALPNGNYVVKAPGWDNQSAVDAGAYFFGDGASSASGQFSDGLTGGNSVFGTTAAGVDGFVFDATRNRLVVGRPPSNTVSILSFETTAIADGDIANPANWSAGLPGGLVSGIIPTGRTMTVSSVVNAGLIEVGCGASLTGGSASAYVVGSVRKDFCTASGETFTYPVGVGGTYSPLTVSNASGSGALTATVSDDFMPGIKNKSKAISRYWSLTGSGVTVDLTFKYDDSDINGPESGFKAFKRSLADNALISQVSSSFNAAANTFTATGVSQFSDWTAVGTGLAPTAAGVSISGRVLAPNGRRLRNTEVILTNAAGETLRTRTSVRGDYRFDGVTAGQSVTIAIDATRYRFAPRVIQIADDLVDVDFRASAP